MHWNYCALRLYVTKKTEVQLFQVIVTVFKSSICVVLTVKSCRTQLNRQNDHFPPYNNNWQLNRHILGGVKRIWCLSPMRAAKVQASLRIPAVSPEPPLLAHTSWVSRRAFRQKARSLAPLNGWTFAVKICHDGILEDTNSLDAPQLFTLCTEHVRSPYTEPAASGLPNPTPLAGVVRFVQAQDQQVVASRSPRIITECLLTRLVLITMYVHAITVAFPQELHYLTKTWIWVYHNNNYQV